tara:strand:+ start:345 stop:1151 length:807 start_codon:yes stop_codon:yes gene_type:complete
MHPISLDQEHIKKLIKISKNAGDAIMDIYESEFDVNFKSDQSPLTKADILSNKIICQSLKKITPELPILSEESSNIPYHERSKWNQYWLIDPLDGTKEFIKKNGEFTTNIALIYKNRPIFGMIYVPARNEIFWGSKEMGSYHINGGSLSNKKKISVSQKTNDNLRIVSSRSHPSEDLKILLDKLENFELVSIGSSLKFCLIAKGEADCYPRFGPTSEWDSAAGEAIVSFAGGKVVTLDNKSLAYNSGESLKNPSFIAHNGNVSLIQYL